MFLTATTKTLRAYIGGAPATTNPDYTVDYAEHDRTSWSRVPGNEAGALNGATPVAILPSPTAGKERLPKFVSIFNRDTAAVTVTIDQYDGATARLVIKATLDPDYSLQWEPGGTWHIYNADGVLVTALTDHNPIRTSPASMTVTTGTLASGTVASVIGLGGANVNVTEVVGAPGFDVQFDWTGVVGTPQTIRFTGYYQGGGNHAPTFQVYDYNAAAWVTLEALYDMTAMHSWSFPSNANFVSAGAMKVRLYHAAAGNGTHAIIIDFLEVISWRP